MYKDSDDGIICDGCGIFTKEANFRDSCAGFFTIELHDVYCISCFKKLNDSDKISFGHIKFEDGLTKMTDTVISG
jgi:hypothetical protein